MQQFQEELDTKVRQEIQNANSNLVALDMAGKLDTPEAIQKARLDTYNMLKRTSDDFQANTVEKAKLAYDYAFKNLEYYRKQAEFNPALTTSRGDNYAYNSAGERMKDATGKEIMGSKQVDQYIDNKDGTYTLMYKDNTFEKRVAGEDSVNVPNEKLTELLGWNTGKVYNSKGEVIPGLQYTPKPKETTPT